MHQVRSLLTSATHWFFGVHCKTRFEQRLDAKVDNWIKLAQLYTNAKNKEEAKKAEAEEICKSIEQRLREEIIDEFKLSKQGKSRRIFFFF